jgi:hypothetical protein
MLSHPMKSLQVESLLRLYNQLSEEDRIVFLVEVDKSSRDLRKAAITIELDREKITDPTFRQLIREDKYIQEQIIIDQYTVKHLETEIALCLLRVEFICKKPEPYMNSMVDSYTMLEFDPKDGVSRNNSEVWMRNIADFEPFDINKLDLSIGPMFWNIYDKYGFPSEIMPHEE